MGQLIRIEVVYVLPQHATVKCYAVAAHSRLDEVLALAARDPAFGGVDFAAPAVGVFGRPARGDQRLEDGDRVEIYRPLAQDPKTARRKRARALR